MPYHEYIIKMYKECDDLYFQRFIDYIISTHNLKSDIFIKGENYDFVKILITGIIKEMTQNIKYNSLYEYYNSKKNTRYQKGDLEIFRHIWITKQYNLKRLLCNVKESEILHFFDQKYRTYLLYNYLIKEIYNMYGHNIVSNIPIIWNNIEFNIYKNTILYEDKMGKPYFDIMLLEEYESGNIQDPIKQIVNSNIMNI